MGGLAPSADSQYAYRVVLEIIIPKRHGTGHGGTGNVHFRAVRADAIGEIENSSNSIAPGFYEASGHVLRVKKVRSITGVMVSHVAFMPCWGYDSIAGNANTVSPTRR